MGKGKTAYFFVYGGYTALYWWNRRDGLSWLAPMELFYYDGLAAYYAALYSSWRLLFGKAYKMVLCRRFGGTICCFSVLFEEYNDTK